MTASTATTPDARPTTDWKPWVGLAARLILGVTYLVSGAIKATNIPEAQLATRAFKILPYDLANLWGAFMPFAEIIFGLLLVLGLFTRWAAVLGSLLMIAFLIGIISAWARGLSINCGCFGGGGEVGVKPNYTWDVLRDLGLLACGAWLVFFPWTKFSLDQKLWG